MIRLIGFEKNYGSRLIVKADNLIVPGGITVIKGHNGSGKTTLFRCIAGILPFTGSIQLFEIDQKKQPAEYRKLVSYSEAKPDFPRFLCGTDIAGFFCSARGVSCESRNGILKGLRVDQFIEERIETYSEGMLKKLSLFLAFIGDCRLIILDEPFAFLDSDARSILLSAIERFQNENKTSFLISNHISDAMTGLKYNSEYNLENHRLIKI